MFQRILSNKKKTIPPQPLCMPEIVSLILSYLLDKDLKPCLFVNRLWHDCGARILWYKLVFEDKKMDYETLLDFATVFAKEEDSCAAAIMTTHHFHVNNDSFSTCVDIHSLIDRSDPRFLLHEPTSKQRHHGTLNYCHIDFYRRLFRCLTIRKIKTEAINETLAQLGRHAAMLEKLELYICDNVEDHGLLPFIFHGRLTHLSLAGCSKITDNAIINVARHCPLLKCLDLRACSLISDTSISAIATHCRGLQHLNVGQIRDRKRITVQSIGLIAKYTQVSVLGLAGCDIDDEAMVLLAEHRRCGLGRISVNNCYKLTNVALHACLAHCPNITVFEIKECHGINDWEALAQLARRKVLLTLCEEQVRLGAEWARKSGKSFDIRTVQPELSYLSH